MSDNSDRVKKQYFIDRAGKSHRYKGSLKDVTDMPSLHTEIAGNLFPDEKYADDYVMSQGWIMMGSSVYHTIIHIKPSIKQIKKLKKLGVFERLCILYDKHYIPYTNE